MIHGSILSGCRRLVAGSALLFVLIAGCAFPTRYDPSLQYPLRSDVLVVKEFSGEARRPNPPGKLDESIVEAMLKQDKEALAKSDPSKLSKGDRDELSQALNEVFGTPARPSVEPTDPESVKTEKAREKAEQNRKVYDAALSTWTQALAIRDDDIANLQLDTGTLRKGSELYRRHCLHCHGLAGDGRGPTGPWVSPHPRDYRRGAFKFISTSLEVKNRKPRRADLYRTLDKGIDGTSMPAFGLQPSAELDAMVSYVIHLSIRGQVEFDTMQQLLAGAKLENGIKDFVYNQAALYLVQWADSNAKSPIKPPDYPYLDNEQEAMPQSIERGYKLFIGKSGCVTCHLDFGRQSAWKYDVWGTLVQPRNLTHANYRGGRRPVDLYWRVAGGITPSGMSALDKTAHNDQEAWDLINFVQALPYPGMLPPKVREKIYPALNESGGSSGEKKQEVTRATPGSGN